MSGVIVGSFIVGIVLGWLSARSARAHSHYDKWQRPDGKGSCCNQLDCRPVNYRQTVAGIEIWITEIGQWHSVLPGTILPFISPDESAHACYVLSWGFGQPKRVPTVWCVALPFQG
jgi:hypothetical protein